MNGTELLVVIGGVVLGFWIVAVFLPSLWDAEPATDERMDPGGERQERVTRGVEHGSGESRRWFEVLAIPESSSRVEIIAAYKRRVRQNHPAVAAKMGRELRELANVQTREINAAYVIALKLRGGHAP